MISDPVTPGPHHLKLALYLSHWAPWIWDSIRHWQSLPVSRAELPSLRDCLGCESCPEGLWGLCSGWGFNSFGKLGRRFFYIVGVESNRFEAIEGKLRLTVSPGPGGRNVYLSGSHVKPGCSLPTPELGSPI